MHAWRCPTPGRGWGRSLAPVVVLLVVSALTGFLTPAGEAGVQPTQQVAGTRYTAEIRRTAQGIPHVRAADYGSLGFGFGYASAEDNACVLAEEFVTLAGERSRFFGPGGSYVALGQTVD